MLIILKKCKNLNYKTLSGWTMGVLPSDHPAVLQLPPSQRIKIIRWIDTLWEWIYYSLQ
jgi:hypothetical protein